MGLEETRLRAVWHRRFRLTVATAISLALHATAALAMLGLLEPLDEPEPRLELVSIERLEVEETRPVEDARLKSEEDVWVEKETSAPHSGRAVVPGSEAPAQRRAREQRRDEPSSAETPHTSTRAQDRRADTASSPEHLEAKTDKGESPRLDGSWDEEEVFAEHGDERSGGERRVESPSRRTEHEMPPRETQLAKNEASVDATGEPAASHEDDSQGDGPPEVVDAPKASSSMDAQTPSMPSSNRREIVDVARRDTSKESSFSSETSPVVEETDTTGGPSVATSMGMHEPRAAHRVDYAEMARVARLRAKRDSMDGYLLEVRRRVEPHWRPRLVLRGERLDQISNKDWDGDGDRALTRVHVRLDSRGEVRELKVRRSSGISSLDDHALAAFRRAAPFPPPPRHLLEEGELVFEWGARASSPGGSRP